MPTVIAFVSLGSSSLYVCVTLYQIKTFGFREWKRLGAGMGRELKEVEKVESELEGDMH